MIVIGKKGRKKAGGQRAFPFFKNNMLFSFQGPGP
jgi:hypothetical protein